MNNPSPKKLTRRDAIKILSAAAGASVLANLPSKWSSPELTSGVLPAHAQTSTLTIQAPCNYNNNTPFNTLFNNTAQVIFTAQTSPNTNIGYQLGLSNLSLNSPSLSGSIMSNSGGFLSLSTLVVFDINDTPNSITNQFQGACNNSTVNFFVTNLN
jgi:hypothetical protein